MGGGTGTGFSYNLFYTNSQDREFYRQEVQKVLKDYYLPAPACVIYGALKTRNVKIDLFNTLATLAIMLENEEVIMFCDPEKNRNSPMRRTYSLKRN